MAGSPVGQPGRHTRVDREKEAAPQRAQRLQEELVAFYCRHQPALIPTAATALASSPLEELLLSLHERFGEIPNEWDIEMRRGQLVAFYGAKDPAEQAEDGGLHDAELQAARHREKSEAEVQGAAGRLGQTAAGRAVGVSSEQCGASDQSFCYTNSHRSHYRKCRFARPKGTCASSTMAPCGYTKADAAAPCSGLGPI